MKPVSPKADPVLQESALRAKRVAKRVAKGAAASQQAAAMADADGVWSGEQLFGLLGVQNEVLDGMARGVSLKETMQTIKQGIDEVLAGARSAIVLFNEMLTKVDLVVASGPDEYVRQLHGLDLGAPGERSSDDTPQAHCESARCESNVDENASLQSDEVRRIAVSLGLYPSWLKPIHSGDNEPLGLIALCFVDERNLNDHEERAVRALTQLARFAIELERRNAALQSANDRFASLTSTIPGVVYQRVVAPDGSMTYTYISEAARDLFGVPPEEILADPQALFNRHGPEYAATFRERLLKASRELTMWDVEASIITPDGQQKYTHAIARPTRRPDGSVQWDGVILDSTRSKEAELATAAAEARTRDTIVESIPDGFVLFGPDDRLVTSNAKFLEFYPELVPYMSADFTYEGLLRAEIEEGLDVENIKPVNEGAPEPTKEARLWRRLERRGQPTRGVERPLADGRWILINEQTTADGSTVLLHTDVTDIKDRESALERSNRELQDFASVASHDLQEPLRKIEAFGDRLKAKYAGDLGADGNMYIERMQNAAGRMRNLINDLLSYSRVTTKAKPFVPVDLDACTRDILSDLQVAIETTDAQIELENLPTIEADSLQMRMLMQNLIANAIKFHKKGERPVIKVSADIKHQVKAGGDAERAGKSVCELRVRDNGIGFDLKYLDRIFSIFQRLHGRNEYEGTGIGLATCRKIVERHNGTITADSAPGDGTTFIVCLPVKQTGGGVQS